MVRFDLYKILPSLGVTILLLFVLDIISSTIFPMIGLENFRLPMHIVIVIYFGLKLQSPLLALLIWAMQYCHSFFSVEGWAVGTIAGIVISIVVSYVRDMIHLNSLPLVSLVSFLFQILWFVIVSIFFFLKIGEFDPILIKFYRFLGEALFLALLSPFIFSFLDKIWSFSEKNLEGDNL